MTESDDAAKPRSAEKGASSAGGADMGELEVRVEKRIEYSIETSRLSKGQASGGEPPPPSFRYFFDLIGECLFG